MPIPATRKELIDILESSFTKLMNELDGAGPHVGELPCVDDWTVKDLLAVRLWWTEHVITWVREGRDGKPLDLPAKGYSWKETPQLNGEIVCESQTRAYKDIVAALRNGFRNTIAVIDSLDDRELLEPRMFRWAGNYPVARWLSMNTARQYTTARTFVRRALREAAKSASATE